MNTNFNTYLANDYDALRRYLGEVRFNALAVECDAIQLSNMRDSSSKLPEQIARLPLAPPELCEIATLERALRDAFEAVEASLPTSEKQKQTRLHPSVRLLTFTQNTVSIWSSLKCGEPPPRAYKLDAPQRVLVWRHNAQPRMRLLGEEEFTSLLAIRDGSGAINQDYFCGWLETEILTDVSMPEAAK